MIKPHALLFVAPLLAFGCGSSDDTSGAGGAGASSATRASSASASASSSSSAKASSSASTASSGGGGSGGAGGGGRSLSTDRTRFFGASRCGAAGVQLCEDFESGAVDTSTWTVHGAQPVVDSVQAARGSKALHITQGGNGLSYISETKTFPAMNGTYYGRAFFYFKQLPSSPGMDYAHWTFVAATGDNVSGEIRLSGQLSNGNNLFGVGTDSGSDPAGTGDWTNSDKDPNNMPAPVPLNQWVCIEWMHSTSTDETRFYWDATEHPSLYTSATEHGGDMNPYLLPDFTTVWLGFQEYQPSSETFELWVDEIAIDPARIGCVI